MEPNPRKAEISRMLEAIRDRLFDKFPEKSSEVLEELREFNEKVEGCLHNALEEVKRTLAKIIWMIKMKNIERILKEFREFKAGEETDSKYKFYYTNARSASSGVSKIISYCLVSQRIDELCIGNRFPTSSISCRINDELVFLYMAGKQNGPLILNVGKKAINEMCKKHVATSKDRHYNSAFVLMDDEIGFFGGKKGMCESFDLKKLKWTDLPSPPVVLIDPFGAYFNNVIFIVDSSNSLIYFSRVSMKYSKKTLLSLKANTKKLIFTFKDSLFLVQNQSLYKYEPIKEDFFHYSEIFHKKYKKIISLPMAFGDEVAFLTNRRKILRILIP